MKHAILIMAHKHFDHLKHLIEYFNRDCFVFVHVDKRSLFKREEIETLQSFPQVVKVYRKFAVHWGGFSILKCEKFLLKESYRLCDATYFHLISGQDYPIKPLSFFLNFFEKNKGKEFLLFRHLPHPNWDNYSFSRFQYYVPCDFLERTPRSKELLIKFVEFQKRIGVKRRIPDTYTHLYGSSQWFSITRHAVQVLLKRTYKHFRLWNRMRFVFAPEECYVATILINELDHRTIIPDNYRYIRWKFENGNYPANLSIEHFFFLLNKNLLFARKMDECSEELIERIDKYLIKEENKDFSQVKDVWHYDGLQQYPYNYDLARSIADIAKLFNVKSAVDIGCGAGTYVIGLRRMGIPIIGFDANPHTEKLSRLFVSEEDDSPCEVVDFTEEVELDSPYDLSICLNTAEYIPTTKRGNFIRNLVSVSGKCIIMNFPKDSNPVGAFIYFQKKGFSENKLFTQYLNDAIKDDNNFKSKIMCFTKIQNYG